MRRLDRVEVTGYGPDYAIVGVIQTRVKVEHGSKFKWRTPKWAKKKLKTMGAVQIVRHNVWEEIG